MNGPHPLDCACAECERETLGCAVYIGDDSFESWARVTEDQADRLLWWLAAHDEPHAC